MAAAPYVAAIFSPFALVACADIWGFANLTTGADAGSDVAASGAGDSASIADVSVVNDSQVVTDAQAVEDAASSDADGGSLCQLLNANSCNGQCTDPSSPCGCVPDYNLNTSTCTNVGASGQDQGCGTDTDCAPGYGCAPATSNCEHWCRSTPACPSPTTCQTGVTPVLINGEKFWWCQ